MRQLHRVVLLAITLGLAPLLAGCENFDLDKLDFLNLNKKKPLPGDRKPVFPEGVPGVSQGIPPEYLQGNLQQQTGAAIDPSQPPVEQGAAPPAAGAPNDKTASAQPVQPAVEAPAEKPKPAAKPKPKPRVAKRTPPAQPASQPQAGQEQQQAAPWPAQAPQQQPAQQAQSQSPWPSPAQNNVAPWPSAPPPGTFSK